MPYDPANFNFTFAHNLNRRQSPETEYATVMDWRLNASYDYSTDLKFLPDNIRFSSDISRNYQEMMYRDVSSANQNHLTFSSNFLWNRDFSVNWNVVRNLIFTFKSFFNKIDFLNHDIFYIMNYTHFTMFC